MFTVEIEWQGRKGATTWNEGELSGNKVLVTRLKMEAEIREEREQYMALCVDITEPRTILNILFQICS